MRIAVAIGGMLNSYIFIPTYINNLIEQLIKHNIDYDLYFCINKLCSIRFINTDLNNINERIYFFNRIYCVHNNTL